MTWYILYLTDEHKHPLVKFWESDSGWYTKENPVPELGLSEGTLCIDTWNEAIKQVVSTVRENWNPDDDMSDFGDYLISVLHYLQYSGVDK